MTIAWCSPTITSLMDGWSLPVLVQELLTLYAHKGDVRALPRVTPYRDYLAWLAAQDRVAATAAWREALAGLEQAHPAGARTEPGRVRDHAREDRAGAERADDRGADRGRRARHGLTLNTMVQGGLGAFCSGG